MHSVPRHLGAILQRALIPGMLLACTGSSPVQPPGPCPNELEIVVGTGLQPSVNWTPGCAARSVSVSPTTLGGSTLPVWQVFAADDVIKSPLRVGDRLPGSSAFGEGESLTSGHRYTVYVVREGRADAAVRSDSLTFTARAGE